MIPPEYLACGPPEGKQNREQFYVALWQGGSLTEGVCSGENLKQSKEKNKV